MSDINNSSKKTQNKEKSEKNSSLIVGRNCVTEALRKGRELDSVMVARGSRSSSLSAIISKAKDKGIPVKECDIKKLDYLCGGAAHQGIAAFAAAAEYSQLEDIFALAERKNQDPFIIILDEIEDPHNLGAIIRTAECAGADGIIIPKRRAAGLTYTVNKASAGALEYMPVVRVTNISAVIDSLKEKGIWVFGTDMDGENVFSSDLTGPIAIVIGSEGKGISRLAAQKCDKIISLPMKGNISSLNASVAAGIVMYEVLNQRLKLIHP